MFKCTWRLTQTKFPSRTLGSEARRRTQRLSRIFVGNLAQQTGWHRLKDFARLASEEVILANVGSDHRGRFGIVEFKTPEAASYAISKMNGSTLDGNIIVAHQDRGDRVIKQNRDDASPNQENQRSRLLDLDRLVVVENLDDRLTWQELKDYMRTAGAVSGANIKEDPKFPGVLYGLVRYFDNEGAQRAIEKLHRTKLGGNIIIVRRFENKR